MGSDEGHAGTPAEDGRRTRWAAHRKQRRVELIGAAIAAVMQHGPEVDMGQVAAAAGISKPVLYRYFKDKTQLWLAVGDFVAQEVVNAVVTAIAEVREEEGLVRVAVDAYLAAIEDKPELYEFLIGRADVPGVHHLVARSAQTVATELARVIGDRLRALGLDAGPAEPWAFGLVGFVQAVGDWWMRRGQPMTRAALTDYLTALLWHGIDGIRASARGTTPATEGSHD